MSSTDARHLPDGRPQAGDRHLNFHPQRDNLFPRAHWHTIWSTNPLKRLNKEIKRRCRVVGIFPNDTAALRLTGAILLETHEELLATDRRYLFETSMAKLSPEDGDTEAVTGELDPAPAA
jgi:hypothetical protein